MQWEGFEVLGAVDCEEFGDEIRQIGVRLNTLSRACHPVVIGDGAL